MTERHSPTQAEKRRLGNRLLIAGGVFALLTLLFLMLVVIAAMMGAVVPDQARFPIVAILALGTAAAASFLGGSAVIKGTLPFALGTKHPLRVSASGGIGVFLIVLLIGDQLYQPTSPAITSPTLIGVSPFIRDTGRVLLDVEFRVENLLPAHTAQLDIATDESFTDPIRSNLVLDDLTSGVATISFERPRDIEVAWVRLVIRDGSERIVANTAPRRFSLAGR